MANFIKTQTSFANGEVAPEFYARDSINGLSRLHNMDVLAGGGVSRRAGLVHVTDLYENARLIPFSVSESENFLLALCPGHLCIYDGDNLVHDVVVPWPEYALPNLQYAQRFGTMIFVHPDFQPHILRRENGAFVLSVYEFARNDENMDVYMPFMRFDDSDGIKITVSTNAGGNNYATLTTSSDFWTSDSVGMRISMLDKQWRITDVTDATHATAYINGGYTLPSAPVTDWRECAFSNRRGWPCSITFHQDRLVYGGSRTWPSGVWLSQVGRHNNFNVGTGLDDEAIFITLLSQQRQQICTVVSSDNLQILTSVGEWAISNKPLTPASVDIKQHTSVGSMAARYLPPQKIEGATIFISANGRDIRELNLDELGEKYNATDLCALAKHLMHGPIDIAYNDQTHQLFVVLADGKMAVLNQNSALGISAWGTYDTNGEFKSVAVVDGCTYVVVHRDGAYAIEKFATSSLSDPDNNNFSFCAAALPLRGGGHNATRVHIRKITARVLDTKSLFINGRRVHLPNDIYASGVAGFTGDVSVNQLGTVRDFTTPLWQIQGTDSLPVTVLSVTVRGFYTV
ncbi:MAG: hypothetical protein NC311_00955 [Muribaculaceae bacterium]|nr:hypothetical protein [Muribaculaceae bacterium]